MKIKFDEIVVIDIEATCWKGKPPQGQQNEIIEVGICTVNISSGERTSKESILVKPTCSKVSKFCTELTTLTQEQVDQGISFNKACSILREKYFSKERTWASYGDYDRSQFEKQCNSLGVMYPFSLRHINVKNLMAILCGLKREVGMAKALQIMNIPLEGTHHRGVDDAWNIGLILSKLMLQRRGVWD